MALLNFYQHTKSQFIPLIPLWDTANFSALRPGWAHPFLTTPTPIFLNQLLFSINLYQHAESQDFSSLSSGDIVNLKILQFDWPTAFWPNLRNQVFPKHEISARIQQIIWNFFIDQIQKNAMTKFSNKSYKPYFWSIFPTFGTKINK